MIKKEYAFVLDLKGNKLSPTPMKNAWYMIRKGDVDLISKYPMVIRLKREIPKTKTDNSKFFCGIDDGSKHVGIAIVQKCKTRNKVVFKGTIEHRQDVKRLMDVRRGYRRYHRDHKRYRKVRFDNRSASKRKERLAPSIKQKKDAILRVVNQINLWCNISKITLEDVQIDIRALTEGKKLYKWQYQKSNRLDENLRKAAIMRDGNVCMECNKKDCILEVHHIVPRRLSGSDTINNLITLCGRCHDKTEGKEEEFIDKYQNMINGKNIRFDYAQHVMQGKHYLRRELNGIALLELTIGSNTANKRIDWSVEKTHSNDAIVITGLNPNDCNINDWIIKPMRRRKNIQQESPHHIKHGDLVSYRSKANGLIIGYVSAIRKASGSVKIRTIDKKEYGAYSYKKIKLLYRFSKIYYIEKGFKIL